LWADRDTLLEAVAASEEKRTDLASAPSITPQMVTPLRKFSSFTEMHLHRDSADTIKRMPTSSTHSRNTSGELTAAISVMSRNLQLSKLPSPLLSNEPKPTIYFDMDSTATAFFPRVNKSSLNGAAPVFSPRPKLDARAQVFAPQPTLSAAAAVFTSRPELNVNAVLFKPAYYASFGPRRDAAVVEVHHTVPALPKDDLSTNKVYNDDQFFKSLLPKPMVLVSGCAVVNGTSEGLTAPLSVVEEKPTPYKHAAVIPQITITNCDQEPELTSDDGSTSDSDISDIRSTYSDEESAKEHSWLPTHAAAPALAVEKGAFAAAASVFFDVFLDRDHASYPVVKIPGLTKQYYDRLSASLPTCLPAMAKPVNPTSKAMSEDSADLEQTEPVVKLPRMARSDAVRCDSLIIKNAAVDNITKQIAAANINDAKEDHITVAKPFSATVEDCDTSSASTETLDHEALEGAETRKSSISSVVFDAHNIEVVDVAHLDRLRKEHTIRPAVIDRRINTKDGRAWLVERGFLPADNALYQADLFFEEALTRVNKELEAADKQLMQLEEERRKTIADDLIAEEALEKAKEEALEKVKKEAAKAEKEVKATKGKGGNRRKKGGKGRN